jgi:hypothetical protein
MHILRTLTHLIYNAQSEKLAENLREFLEKFDKFLQLEISSGDEISVSITMQLNRTPQACRF